MSTGPESHHRLILQFRIVGKATGASAWQKAPKMHSDIYAMMAYRDKTVQWLEAGKSPDPLTDAFVQLLIEVLKIDDAYMETRIIKRTFTDEVVEEIQKVVVKAHG